MKNIYVIEFRGREYKAFFVHNERDGIYVCRAKGLDFFPFHGVGKTEQEAFEDYVKKLAFQESIDSKIRRRKR